MSIQYCEKCRKSQKKWQKNNLDRIREIEKTNDYKVRRKAYNLIRALIKLKKIVKPDECENKDDTCKGRIEFYHEDYNKPHIVKWLCDKHRKELHKKLKQ